MQNSDRKYFKRGDLVDKELEEYNQKYGRTLHKETEDTTSHNKGKLNGCVVGLPNNMINVCDKGCRI